MHLIYRDSWTYSLAECIDKVRLMRCVAGAFAQRRIIEARAWLLAADPICSIRLASCKHYRWDVMFLVRQHHAIFFLWGLGKLLTSLMMFSRSGRLIRVLFLLCERHACQCHPIVVCLREHQWSRPVRLHLRSLTGNQTGNYLALISNTASFGISQKVFPS